MGDGGYAGLFAMKRESWAGLVRVSSVARYTPSWRIAKGLERKRRARFSSSRWQQHDGAASRSGNVRSVHFQAGPVPSLLSVVRRSLPASNKRRPYFYPQRVLSRGTSKNTRVSRHLDLMSVCMSVWPVRRLPRREFLLPGQNVVLH